MFIILLVLISLVMSPLLHGQEGERSLGLERVFTVSGLLLDGDGDGFPDGIKARLILGDSAPETVAAAAEIAARLGLETCGLDTSLLDQDPGLAIHVNRTVSDERVPEGRGVVIVEGNTIHVLGGKPGTLLAAARALAGSLPEFPEGGKLADLRPFLSPWRHLSADQAARVRFDRLEVVPGLRRLAHLRARLDLSSADLTALIARQKSAPASEEKIALPVAGLAELLLEIRDETGRNVSATVRCKDEKLPPLNGVSRGGKGKRFGLQQLFSPAGVLVDGDGDLVPDGCSALIIASGEAGSEAAVDVATRLGLETAGLRFPLTALPDELAPGKVAGPLLLVGEDQALVKDLIQRGVWKPTELAPGSGEVRIVLDAFKKQSAVIVRGGDAAGLRRAGRLLLERIPHMSDGRVDAPNLADLAASARQFLAGVSPAGQAARVRRSAGILAEHPDVESDTAFHVAVNGLPADKGARDAVKRHWLQVLPRPLGAVHENDPRRVDGQKNVLDRRFDLPWEVDFHRLMVAREVLPKLKHGDRVQVEVLVSEPRKQRDALRAEIIAALTPRLGSAPAVTVLSAWKPGFQWLTEVVLPAAKKSGARRIEIAAPLYTERSAARWSTLNARSRWFLELHPAIEIMAASLGLDPDKDFSFRTLTEQRHQGGEIPRVRYEIRLWSEEGRAPKVLTFEPALRRMPFSRVFPGYESVVLSTGRMRVTVNGKRVHDALVQTDLESIWTTYQEEVLTRLREDLMDQSRGRPDQIRPPFFGLAQFVIKLSEEDRRLTVGQELISPPEALYEELYFHTLWFTSFIGQIYTGKPIKFPGTVIPSVQVTPGEAPHFRARLVGKKYPAAGIWTGETAKDGPHRLLPRVKIREPRVLGLRVGVNGRMVATVRVFCQEDADRRSVLVRQAAPAVVDATIFAAETGVALVDELRILRGLGAYRQTMGLPGLDAVEFEFAGPAGVRRARLDADPMGYKLGAPPKFEGVQVIIPGRTPIAPDEAASLLSGLAERHDAGIYKAGQTYGGRKLWALETGPVAARHYSRVKLSAWKPVLLISAREHANEVSSTNHVLQFLQECLNEPEVLAKVTLVVKPVWNADGAEIAVAQFRDHKDWMLHAGYLGALGQNIRDGMNDPDSVYPEARVRVRMFQRHLPDVFLNPHGYPSHEWVQPFSGYAAWVRGRDPKTRDWWGARGWFLTNFAWPDGEKFGEQKQAALSVRDRISEKIAALPEVMALNREGYARYLRYGALDPDTYRMPLVNGVQIRGALHGSKPKKTSDNFALRYPKTCAFYGVTEAPDETAHGKYLELICQAGRAFSRASLEHLLEGDARIRKKVTHYRDGVTRSRARKRPVMPSAKKKPTSR